MVCAGNLAPQTCSMFSYLAKNNAATYFFAFSVFHGIRALYPETFSTSPLNVDGIQLFNCCLASSNLSLRSYCIVAVVYSISQTRSASISINANLSSKDTQHLRIPTISLDMLLFYLLPCPQRLLHCSAHRSVSSGRRVQAATRRLLTDVRSFLCNLQHYLVLRRMARETTVRGAGLGQQAARGLHLRGRVHSGPVPAVLVASPLCLQVCTGDCTTCWGRHFTCCVGCGLF